MKRKDTDKIRREKFQALTKQHGYDNPKEMLSDLYEQMDKQEVRKFLKVGWNPLSWALKEYDVEMRPSGAQGRSSIVNAEVKKYLKTHTQKEAAEHFNCSQVLISRINLGLRREVKPGEQRKIEQREHDTFDYQGPPIEVEFDEAGFLAAGCKINACYFCSNENGNKKNPTCDSCKWKEMYNMATTDPSYPGTRSVSAYPVELPRLI